MESLFDIAETLKRNECKIMEDIDTQEVADFVKLMFVHYRKSNLFKVTFPWQAEFVTGQLHSARDQIFEVRKKGCFIGTKTSGLRCLPLI
jgi:hypothetical protein